MIKIVGVSISLLFFIYTSYGQDAVFSQFYNSTLYLNPAMAGIEKDAIFSSNYREQWNALLFPYKTTQASVVIPYFRDKHQKPFGHIGGFGLSIYNDVAGQDNNFKTTGVNGNFAYNLPLDEQFVNVIHFGLQVGFIQKRIDATNLQWGEQYNPYIGFDPSATTGENLDFQSKAFMDIGSGVFWWYTPLPQENRNIISINSGLSVAHMNNPNESIVVNDVNRLPLLYKYHGSVLVKLHTHLTASFNTLVAFQNLTTQGNVGTYLTYRFFAAGSDLFAENFIRLGGWYRVKDAAILLTEFESTKFKLGFSYDWNTSDLRYQNRGIGTYELFFSIKFTSHAPPKSRY